MYGEHVRAWSRSLDSQSLQNITMCETNENYMNQQNINNYTSQQSSSSHPGRYRVY